MAQIAAVTREEFEERQQLSLDGAWDFRMEGAQDWRTATIPGPWQAQFDDLRHSFGTATYVRTFTLPAGWRGREVALRFGAVSYLCEVLLNGAPLGTHEGGYLPFEFILPESALDGENRLEVRATLPNGDTSKYPDSPFSEIPHGKQSWYGPLGGIWQSVTLEARDKRSLVSCAIAPNSDTGEVAVRLELSPGAGDASVALSVLDAKGRLVGTLEAGPGATEARLRVDEIRRWSPEAPHLYTLIVDVTADGAVVDSTAHTFGFRKIETRDGKFFLNGEPLYLRGALDQDYYPEGICTPPSLEFLEDQFRKAKELGLNLLRCHIKVPDPRYYEVADRMGMLIWTEIPNVSTFSARSSARLRETMEGILRRDGNHPSIIIWTIINEDWGTRLVENADHRQWLKESYDWLKALDPTRLVVDNSACIPNFHLKTDINDYHYYKSVPERRAEWEKLTEEFANGAEWTFSPHGDSERRGDEPLVVSEFGVWGLPNPKQVLTADGKEPFWFESGPGWGDGTAYPHGIQSRFATYHLDTVFGTLDNFIDQVQWYQFGNLKYEIESMRSYPSIMGYVITEFTDVHWEANGLLDINRNPRVFHERFPEINSDLVIVPHMRHYAAYGGERVQVSVRLATGGGSIPAGAMLTCTVDGVPCGMSDVPETGAFSVIDLGTLEVDLPQTSENRIAHIEFHLAEGTTPLARNSFDMHLYAPRQNEGLPVVACRDHVLRQHLASLGYQLGAPETADVIVVHGLDASDIEALRHGARYLVLADGGIKTHHNLRIDTLPREQPFMAIVDEIPGLPPHPEQLVPGMGLHKRHYTIWRGDWIASFSWIKRSGPFSSIPGGPLLDVAFDRVVPHHVLTGFRAWEFEGLIHAGIVVGWVHKPAVTIAERRVGKGGVVATTFRLTEDAPGEDPVASAMLDALLVAATNMKTEQRAAMAEAL